MSFTNTGKQTTQTQTFFLQKQRHCKSAVSITCLKHAHTHINRRTGAHIGNKKRLTHTRCQMDGTHIPWYTTRQDSPTVKRKGKTDNESNASLHRKKHQIILQHTFTRKILFNNETRLQTTKESYMFILQCSLGTQKVVTALTAELVIPVYRRQHYREHSKWVLFYVLEPDLQCL